MAITIGPGITVGAGVALIPAPASIVTTGLVLSLDAGNPCMLHARQDLDIK